MQSKILFIKRINNMNSQPYWDQENVMIKEKKDNKQSKFLKMLLIMQLPFNNNSKDRKWSN